MTALAWFLAGAYATGLMFSLWATCGHPWPDRALIAVCWPVAAVWNVWR